MANIKLGPVEMKQMGRPDPPTKQCFRQDEHHPHSYETEPNYVFLCLGKDAPKPSPETQKLRGGWKTPPNPMYHPCSLPVMEYQDAGRPWECPDCGAIWSLSRWDNVSMAPMMDDTPISPVVDAVPIAPKQPEVVRESEHVSFSEPGFYEELAEPGDGSITKVKDHAPSCAFRLGTGMCSCELRKTI